MTAVLEQDGSVEHAELLRRLRETEARFKNMADVAPVLLWMSREDGLCTFFNQTWLDFTGRTLEQEWGVGWAEGVHPEDFRHCMDGYTAAFNERRVFELEYRLRRHDGVYRWILDRGTPRYLPDRTFAGYIGSCVDITERRTIEVELRQAVRARDEFLSIASHELRTPLTALGLAVDGLLRQHERGEYNEEVVLTRLRTLRRQADRLDTLVESLLNVSRLREGRIEIKRENCDLSEVTREVVERLRDEADREGCRVGVAAAGPVPGYWDKLRLELVITNLLVNAVKYGKGRPIEVRVDPTSSGGRLSVRDYGIGIAPEHHPRIFKQFARAVSDQHYGGLGLGLWICSEIVAAMSGTISVQSALGAGSTFTVELPNAARHDTDHRR